MFLEDCPASHGLIRRKKEKNLRDGAQTKVATVLQPHSSWQEVEENGASSDGRQQDSAKR